MLGAVAKHNGLTTAEQEWAGKVFEATTIQEGSIALSPEDLGKKMDRRTYREHIHDNLLSLSLDACRKSLADWGTVMACFLLTDLRNLSRAGCPNSP